MTAAHTDLVLSCKGEVLVNLGGYVRDKGQLLLILVCGGVPGHTDNGGPDNIRECLRKRTGGNLILRCQRLDCRRSGLLVQLPDLDGLAAIARQRVRPVIEVAHLLLGGQRNRNLLGVAPKTHLENILPRSGVGQRCGIGVLGENCDLLDVVELVHEGSAAQQTQILVGVAAPQKSLFGNFL